MSKHDSIFKAAAELWGERAQLNMIFEELAELQVALAQFLRGRIDKEKVAGEIADARIVIDQLEYLLWADNSKPCQEKYEEKLRRLIERLKKGYAGYGIKIKLA